MPERGDHRQELSSTTPASGLSSRDIQAASAFVSVPVTHEREKHVTPDGVVQPFTWAVLRRT